MRFRQGSIEISAVHDEPILRLVLRSGYLSHEQMLRFMRLGCGYLPSAFTELAIAPARGTRSVSA